MFSIFVNSFRCWAKSFQEGFKKILTLLPCLLSDLDSWYGGEWHWKHEVHVEWGSDDWDPGRGQCGDAGGADQQGGHVHFRHEGQRGRGTQEEGVSAVVFYMLILALKLLYLVVIICFQMKIIIETNELQAHSYFIIYNL